VLRANGSVHTRPVIAGLAQVAAGDTFTFGAFAGVATFVTLTVLRETSLNKPTEGTTLSRIG
jgi:hypothetical protein